MPYERWDALVVGGGPAGCAAAATILHRDPRARVLILDREEFPRDKVCGDGIAAQVFHVLAGLGLDKAELAAGYPARRWLRLQSPGGRSVQRTMREDVFVIPRQVFDARLMAAVRRQGAVLRQHTVRRVDEVADGVVVDDRFHCSVLIGADGAESTVRRTTGHPRNRPGHLAVAIRGYASELLGQDGAQIIIMGRQHWPAYAWSFPVGDGLANVGYGEVVTADPISRASMMERMHELLPGLASGPIEVRGHRLPLSTDRPAVRDGRVLLVGDALSLINPLSGEGIYYAVRSGMAAGEAATAGRRAGEVYRQLLNRGLHTHLRHTGLLTRLLRWPRLLDAGVEAAHRNQGAFDDLVDLALADGLITRRLIAGLRW